MIIRKCHKCGALIKILNDCKCNMCRIKCCNEEMTTLFPNTFDAVVEKHVPEYQVVNQEIIVKVNHVMDDDHYIEWIRYIYDNCEQINYFNPGDEPIATFKYVKGAIIYAYCNKHALWSKVVE